MGTFRLPCESKINRQHYAQWCFVISDYPISGDVVASKNHVERKRQILVLSCSFYYKVHRVPEKCSFMIRKPIAARCIWSGIPGDLVCTLWRNANCKTKNLHLNVWNLQIVSFYFMCVKLGLSNHNWYEIEKIMDTRLQQILPCQQFEQENIFYNLNQR